MARWTFETRLVRPEGTGTWTFAPVPPRIGRETGIKARLKVRGEIDGTPFVGTLLPQGSGKHFIVVNRDLRERIGKTAGDKVRIEMDVDTSPHTVEVPEVLAAALAGDEAAKSAFEKMAPSHKKAYVGWIEEAKRPETQAKRVAKAVEMMAKGVRL